MAHKTQSRKTSPGISIQQQLTQRNTELALINTIQAAVASRLEMHKIYELVGEKIHDLFKQADVNIRIYDPQTNLVHYPYYSENGKRINLKSAPLDEIGFESHILRSQETLLINEQIEKVMERYGSHLLPGESIEKSSVFVPLIVGGQARGLLNLRDMRQEHAFTESDVSLLTTLANSLGVALENARLLDEARRHDQEITIMADVGREISATLDLPIVLERIASRAMSLFRARDVVLRLLEPDGHLRAAVALGKHAAIYKHWHARLGQGLSGTVAQTAIPEIINDPENDPRVIDIPGTQDDKATRAILFAPLIIGESVIGVLSVWRDILEVGPFTQADLEFGSSLARQAAIAIQNARLFAESQQRFKETEILRAANMELTRSLDLDAIFATLLDYLQQLVPYDSGSIFLLNDENHLAAVAARGYENWVPHPEKAIGVTFDFKNIPHIRAVIEDQTTLIIPDVTQNPDWVVAETATHVRNWLAVPLVAGNNTIGMYSLDKVQPGFFTPEHRRLAENLAAQAAIAFQNATFFRNQQVAREQAETLHAAASALGSTLSLRDLFEVILTELRKVVPYDSCSVQQLDGNEMVIVGGHGFPNLDQLLGTRFDWRGLDDPAGDVVRLRRPVIIPDVSARFKHFKDETHGQGRVHGWMGVPLLFGENLIGMLTLDKTEENFYTPSHAHLAQAFAIQAATAIENARLFETEQVAREQAEAQSRQVAALNRVAQAVTSTLDLQTVLETAAREMVDLLNARSVGIGLLNPDRTELRIVAYFSRQDEPSAVGLIIPVEGNLATQQVIETGQAILISDPQNTPLQNEETRAVMRSRNTQCILLLPLLAHGEVIGTIGPDTDQPDRAFSIAEIQLAQTITNQLAGAIDNARLFDQSQRLLVEARKAHETAEALRSASLAFTESLNIETILERVLDYLALLIPYDSATIFVLENETQLVARAIRGYERFTDVSLAQMMRIERNSVPRIDRILDEQTGRIIPDTTQDPTWTWVPTTMHIRSWLAVPLVVNGRTIGLYSLDKAEPNFFNEEHRRLAESLAAQAAVVIETSQLFEKEQLAREQAEAQSRQMAALNRVAQAVTSTLDLKTMLEIAARELVLILNARSVGVGLLNEQRSELEIVAYFSVSDEPSAVGLKISMEGNLATQQVIQTSQPILITDAQHTPLQDEATRAVMRARNTHCILILPLLARGAVIGTIAPDIDRPDRVFSPEQVQLAQTIANQIAGAIENARLFNETQHLFRQTEQRAAELDAIGKVSQALIVESELDRTIQLIGSQVQEIFNADIVYLALLDPRTNLIHFPYQIGESFTTLQPGEGLTGKIIETGEPILISRDVDAYSNQLGVAHVGTAVRSYLGVPVKTSQGTVGVISVQSTAREGAFNEASLRLLTTIAANAGAALHNARLFSDALENLRQVEILTTAARAIEDSDYDPAMVESVAVRTDALGNLARVFRKMADEVRLREQRLKRQLAQLQLDIEEKNLAKAETLAIYIPMDRRQALAAGKTLPEYVHGTALFADVSGFTALTESLAIELGLQRGAEEMIRHINRVFTTLIDEIHAYRGAVIGFSGDALTSWFDDLDLDGHAYPESSVERAVACALAMQTGMTKYEAIMTPNGKTIALSVKVALAAGPARRLLVGDGTPHQIDEVAGDTLAILAGAEHQAERGEIILAAAGLPALDETFIISGWREAGQYALIGGLRRPVQPCPWPELSNDSIPEALIRPWLHPTVFEKVRAGQSDMLSELRPATALFMKFGGLDFDNDPQANARLDEFIQWVEQVIAPHHGSIIQFTIGDKGSYIYVVFGAPHAHKDDALQAVLTALELASPPGRLSYMTDLYIGLASGQMRVGPYGGSSHRTYGAIGDRTNLAARLMMAASCTSAEFAPGQRAIILCNDSVYAAAQAQVEFESLPPVIVKGKTEPVAIYRPLRKLGPAPLTTAISPEELSQRMDGLSPAQQLTLKVASIIGDSFTLEALSAIYPERHTREDLENHLRALIQAGLICRRVDELSGYEFAEALIHAAAYNLMLFAQRRQLHRVMAELLEQTVFSVPPYAEIAHHWQAADEIPRAVQYLEKAGEQARQMGNLEEATRFFNASLSLGD